MKTTLIFDIGKTNKKLFLFDPNFKEIHQEYVCFPETVDEDGHPCDDLSAIAEWMSSRFQHFLRDESIQVEAVNFSTYGASLVHLDRSGRKGRGWGLRCPPPPPLRPAC